MYRLIIYLLREGFKKKKKKVGIFQLYRGPPPPPPKVGKYPIFFYMTRRANFLLFNFSHIRVMKHTISKNQNFQKNSLLYWGWDPKVPSHETSPWGGGRAVSLK